MFLISYVEIIERKFRNTYYGLPSGERFYDGEGDDDCNCNCHNYYDNKFC